MSNWTQATSPSVCSVTSSRGRAVDTFSAEITSFTRVCILRLCLVRRWARFTRIAWGALALILKPASIAVCTRWAGRRRNVRSDTFHVTIVSCRAWVCIHTICAIRSGWTHIALAGHGLVHECAVWARDLGRRARWTEMAFTANTLCWFFFRRSGNAKVSCRTVVGWFRKTFCGAI